MIKRIFFILDRKEKKVIPFLLIEIILGAFLETIGISALLPIVNILVDQDVITSNSFISKLYLLSNSSSVNSFLMLLFFITIFFYLFKNLYIFMLNYHQYSFINQGQRRLTKRLIKGYFSQEYSCFLNKNVSDIQRNISSDVGRCYQTILSILMVVTQLSICSALIIFLLCTDFSTSIITIFLVVMLMSIYYKITHKLSYKYGTESRKYGQKVIQWINQSIAGIKEIKLLNRESFFISKIDESYSVSASSESKANVISCIPPLLMEATCVISILVACIVRLQYTGNLQGFINTIAAFALVAIRIIPLVGGISSRINMITFNKSSIYGIYGELLVFRNNVSNNTPISSNHKIGFKNAIEVKHLSFKYPRSKKYIFKDIDLTIRKGQSVAFIGPSGAGKSTLADIIIGMLIPTYGEVRIDDFHINDVRKDWASCIGYIPQYIYIIDDSIRANVAFGIDDDKIDDNKVWEVLKLSKLYEFVTSLPDGIYTNLGDRGARCSGGQRQRIGIARALYNNPDFLVLDEATSALDNETEKLIMDTINNLKGSITILIIAHRLSTIKNCDKVYRIENNSVKEVSF